MKKFITLFCLALIFSFNLEAKIYIISDVDDTLKQSNALDKKDMLKRHLWSGVPAFPFIVDIFNELRDKYHGEIDFYYLSKLNPFYNVKKWVEKYDFPTGKVRQPNLREWRNSSGGKFKKIALEEYLKNIDFNEEDIVIFIGDNGELDEDVYLYAQKELLPEIVRKNSFIYIRDVRGQAVKITADQKPIRKKNILYFLSEIDLLKSKFFNYLTPKLKSKMLEQGMKQNLIPQYISEQVAKHHKKSHAICLDLILAFIKK